MLNTLTNLIQSQINARRYTKLADKVKRPIFQPQQLKEQGYYGQYGQDKWLVETLLKGIDKGVFIDIGANDGISFSNTYYLEKMGWTGIAVEPIKSVYAKLVKNRRCITINGCICPKTGVDYFRSISGHGEMLSGLISEYHPKHLRRIKRSVKKYGSQYQDIKIDCYNFNELLAKNTITRADYLNIDVEGVEYKILNSIDFDNIHISVIGVENNYKDPTIPALLIKKGFEFHSILGDDFYLNSNLLAKK